MKAGKTQVKVNIYGIQGSGKTVLLHEIGAALKARGFNVRCFDEDGHRILPSPNKDLKVDQRGVRIKTFS